MSIWLGLLLAMFLWWITLPTCVSLLTAESFHANDMLHSMKSTDTSFGAMIKLHSLVAAVRFLLVQKKKKNLYFLLHSG